MWSYYGERWISSSFSPSGVILITLCIGSTLASATKNLPDACFDTLPGYASRLAMDEFDTYSSFANALRQGFIGCISQNTVQNDEVVKWAYNVALTRFHEVWKPTRQKMIAPMADMVSIFGRALNVRRGGELSHS